MSFIIIILMKGNDFMKKLFWLLLLMSLLFAGCSFEQNEDQKMIDEELVEEVKEGQETAEAEVHQEIEIIKEAINYEELKPNELGNIMVIMYHGIDDNPPYQRTAQDFRKDLEYMYENGYRLIRMEDYISGRIDVEPGLSPIVLTFDDGLSTTFSLEEGENGLVPKDKTAISILEEFCKEHPDFGKAATLYINGDTDTFSGAGSLKDRLSWLVENGYEIGNHTYSHPKLNKLSEDQVLEEIGKVDLLIKELLPEYPINTLSYPHGIRPSEEARSLAEGGTFQNVSYSYKLGLREGPSGPMHPAVHKDFDAYNCPRVRGSSGEEGDLWWWFAYYEDQGGSKYISDGDIDTIAAPKELEDRVNFEVLEKSNLSFYGY